MLFRYTTLISMDKLHGPIIAKLKITKLTVVANYVFTIGFGSIILGMIRVTQWGSNSILKTTQFLFPSH